MSVGDKIKAARKQRKLTQIALAERANISRSYLADLEGGRYNPSLDTLEAIASALNTETSALLSQDSPITNSEITPAKKNELRSIMHDNLIKAQELFQLTDLPPNITQYIDELNKRYSTILTDQKNMVLTHQSLNSIYNAVQSLDVQSKKFTAFSALLNELIDLKKNIANKNTSVPESAAEEFKNNIELSDDELIEQFSILVDGRRLSPKAIQKIIAQVRLDRMFEDQE